MINTEFELLNKLYQNASTGIIDINEKQINIKTGGSCIFAHAKEILKCEQQYIDKLKSYL